MDMNSLKHAMSVFRQSRSISVAIAEKYYILFFSPDQLDFVSVGSTFNVANL